MIVKNEGSCLAACLESVKDANEIIVCDTGSTDNTVEIARRYTDKVYTDYQWCDHFADARNHSLGKCTGDWVLIIDADETLEEGGINKIRQLKTHKDAVYFQTISKSSPVNIHKSIRLFRNNGKITWQGRVHNYLNTADAQISDIQIRYGYSEAHKLDPDRALRILSKVVTEEPGCVREKYYLAREYWYRKNYKLAIIYYDYYLETATWGPEMADAHLMTARCYAAMGDWKRSRESCLKALNINADFKEALLWMATTSGPKNAIKWQQYANSANNEDVLFIRT